MEFDDINYILTDIMDKSKDEESEKSEEENEKQNIDFVIKDVERIGDNVANELYKIMN
jgi:hypothetical protein